MTTPHAPTKYSGPNEYLVSKVVRNRQPTLADYRQPETGKNYPIGCVWQVGKDPTDGSEGQLFSLSKIIANQGYWVLLNSGSGSLGPLLTLSDTSDTLVYPTAGGNIQLEADTGVTITSDPGNNKLVFSSSGSVPTIIFTDSGNATPSMGGLNVFGAGGITTSGSGSTVTIDTDGTIALKYNADTGSAIPVSGELDIVGSNLTTTSASGDTVTINSFAVSNFIVSADPLQGNYTTIQSAINAASSGDTVFIKDGTYTEDLDLKPGVNLCGWGTNVVESTVNPPTIIGKITSTTGNAKVYGLCIKNDGDYAIDYQIAGGLYFIDCIIVATDFTAIHLDQGSGNLYFYRCYGNIQTAGLSYFHVESGDIWFYDCQFNSQAAGPPGMSISEGPLTAYNTSFGFPINSLSSLNMHYCTLGNGGASLPCLDIDQNPGVAQSTISNSFLSTGTEPCIEVDDGFVRLLSCSIACNADFPISGTAGNISGSFDWHQYATQAPAQNVQFNDSNSYSLQAVFGAATTDATPYDINATFGGLLDGQMVTICATVAGIKDDGSKALSCELIFGARCVAGVAILIGGAVVSKTIQSDFTTADVTYLVSSNNAGVILTGEAATNINWSVQINQIYR